MVMLFLALLFTALAQAKIIIWDIPELSGTSSGFTLTLTSSVITLLSIIGLFRLLFPE